VAETLVIHLHGQEELQASWRPLYTGEEQPQGPAGNGSLAEAAVQAKGRQVIVFVPSAEITLAQMDAPTSNRQRLLQAVPYAIENALIEDVATLHFAIDTRADGKQIKVAVVAQRQMDYWLESLEDAGIEPSYLYPDFLGLPHTPGSWTVYLDDDQVLVRTGLNTGFGADPINFAELLRLSLEEHQDAAPEQIEFILPPNLSSAPYYDLALSKLDYPATTTAFDGNLIELMAKGLDPRSLLNLLQGEYRHVDAGVQLLKPWISAAVLLMVFLTLQVTLSVLDFIKIDQENSQLSQQISQLFHSTFPETKRLVDAKAQTEQKLKELRTTQSTNQADFFSLFIAPASAIKESRGSKLRGISYRDGQLDIQLSTREIQAIEALKKRLENEGLAVEIRSANAKGNEVTSHLRITRGGS